MMHRNDYSIYDIEHMYPYEVEYFKARLIQYLEKAKSGR